MMESNFTLTAIPGLRVGHAQNDEALTGCTVVLCEQGAVGGVDQRGGAPGTRETDGLHPMHLVRQVHGIVLAGGSAFGLDAATGVVRYLEERGVGFDVGVARVPIVPAAILFDLGIGRADIRPDAEMGYQACLNATEEPVREGNFGAGCGATVGKILGISQAMKSGIGSAAIHLGDGLVIAALAAVNAMGEVIDPQNGQIIAGPRPAGSDLASRDAENKYIHTLDVLKTLATQGPLRFGGRAAPPSSHTVIGVVATNASLEKEGANKIAQMAHDGLARTIRPAHTLLDGDTIFSLATGEIPADVNVLGAFAAEAFAQAILRAVRMAQPAGGLPSASVY